MILIKNKLKDIINERNINVSKMADKVGISRNSFYGLYKDNQSFKNETWTKIANYLNLTINDLFYSVSEEVQIKLVRELSTDNFPKRKGLYVGNYIFNLSNFDYAIDVDVQISYKIVVSDEYVSIYYDYSNSNFLYQNFLDTIMKNDNNKFNLFVFMYNNLIKDLFGNSLPFVFINSINGSYIDFYANKQSLNDSCLVFLYNYNNQVYNEPEFKLYYHGLGLYENMKSNETLEKILNDY